MHAHTHKLLVICFWRDLPQFPLSPLCSTVPPLRTTRRLCTPSHDSHPKEDIRTKARTWPLLRFVFVYCILIVIGKFCVRPYPTFQPLLFELFCVFPVLGFVSAHTSWLEHSLIVLLSACILLTSDVCLRSFRGLFRARITSLFFLRSRCEITHFGFVRRTCSVYAYRYACTQLLVICDVELCLSSCPRCVTQFPPVVNNTTTVAHISISEHKQVHGL